MSASRTRVRNASALSPGSGVSAETSIAFRTSLSGIAVSFTVAAIRSTISAETRAAVTIRAAAHKVRTADMIPSRGPVPEGQGLRASEGDVRRAIFDCP